MDLFVYGTLLFPDVLEALLGRVPAMAPAHAAGWRVAALPGRLYPGLVAHRQATASGMVITGLELGERRLLDAYEDTGYRLTAIDLADGRNCAAYVWRTAVLAEDWCRRTFAEDHLAGYVERCARWRATCGRPPPPATGG